MTGKAWFSGSCWAILGWTVWSWAGSPVASAQDGTAARWFGEGIHAYYDGRYDTAEEWLRKVAERTSDDPRPYYFLGLALLGQGKQDEGRKVIAEGAKIEARQAALAVDISRSLLRVQGRGRLLIEQLREQARRDKAAADAARAKARYEARTKAERLTLYPPKLIPGAEKIAVTIPAAADRSSDPFLSGKLFAAGKPVATQPSLPKVAGSAGRAAAPKEPAGRAAKPKKSTADPFAGGGDPFGGAGGAKPAPQSGSPFGDAGGAKPAAKKPPAKSDDPLGNDPFK